MGTSVKLIEPVVLVSECCAIRCHKAAKPCNRRLRALATVLSPDRHKVQLRLKNASHLLSPCSRPCTMFDLCHFSSIAVGEGPHVLVSGHLLEPTASICISCLALRPSPKRGRSAMCTSTLLQLLGLSMLTFSDTFETARLRRDACTARMYLVATLLQHHIGSDRIFECFRIFSQKRRQQRRAYLN